MWHQRSFRWPGVWGWAGAVALLLAVGAKPTWAAGPGHGGYPALFVANRVDYSISLFEPLEEREVASLRLPGAPMHLSVSPYGEFLFATLDGATSPDQVHVIRLDAYRLSHTLSTGIEGAPLGVQLAPGGRHLWLYATNGNQASVLSFPRGTVLATVTFEAEPQAVLFPPDEAAAFVIHEGSTAVLEIDPADYTVRRRIVLPHAGTAAALRWNDEGAAEALYVVHGAWVSVVDLRDGGAVRTSTLPGVAHDVALDVDSGELWVVLRNDAQLAALDAETLELLATVDTPPDPTRVAVAPPQWSPEGTRIYVTHELLDEISTIDPRTRTVSGTLLAGWGPHAIVVNP